MYISIHNKPSSAQARDRTCARVPRTVVTLGVVSLLTDVSTEMITAALPLFVTVGLGLSPLAFGAIDSIYQAGTAVSRLIGGYIADRFRRPKTVASWGYGLGFISKLLMLGVSSIGTLSIALGADRFGKGMRTGPRDTLIAAASEPSALGRSFGVHRALDTAGALLGPVVAFYLLLLAPGNFNMLFIVASCFAALGLLFLICHVPRDPRSRADKPGMTERRPVIVRSLLQGTHARRLLIAAAILALLTVSDAFIYLTLLERDLVTAQLFPLLFVATSLVYLATAIPIGRLADSWSRIGVFITGHFLIVAAYLLVAASHSLFTAALALGLLGLYYAATDGVLPAAMVPLIGSEARSTAISAVQTVVALGRSAAALAFGSLWAFTSASVAMYVFAAGLFTALMVAAPILIHISRHQDAGAR